MKNILLSFLFLLMITTLGLNSDVFASTMIIDKDTTSDRDIVIGTNDTLQINSGVTFTLIHRIDNNGTINNDGTIINNGWSTSSNGRIVNSGIIFNNWKLVNERGGIDNSGTIENHYELNNNWKINNYAIFTNFGTITNNPGGDINNKQTLENDGTILNSCDAQVRGIITGNPVEEQCDVNPPIITLPNNMIAEATSSNGAIIAYEVSAFDDKDGQVPVTCDPISGSIFQLGTTVVNCSAKDSLDNESTEGFTVIIEDTTAPQISVPANIVIKTSNSQKVNYPKVTATDTVDGVLEPQCNPSRDNLFPIGENEVICSISDNSGNTSSKNFFIVLEETITPNESPILTLPGQITKISTSNHGAEIEFNVKAVDKEDGPLPVSCDHSSNSIFPIDITTVECSAQDNDGNIVSGTFDVIILSNQQESVEGQTISEPEPEPTPEPVINRDDGSSGTPDLMIMVILVMVILIGTAIAIAKIYNSKSNSKPDPSKYFGNTN